MHPYYQDAHVTIYHGDCREVLPTLPSEAAIISDPPYGMDWNTDSTRFSGGNRRLGHGVNRRRVFGDTEPFDPEPFVDYANCVLFGVNHFAQRVPVGTWLVWTKKPAARYGSFLSDAEVAWMKGGHGIYVREYGWEGLNRAGERGEHYHPTQKPVAIMKWCIEMGGGNDVPIIDPFMGSGTTLRAAKDMGRHAIGVEIDERYCEIAARRCLQETLELGV